MSDYYWKFPQNGVGELEGINDSGIETYKDQPVYSLARETIQNSLDARRESESCVEVHFRPISIPSEEFPDRDGLKRIFEALPELWSQEDDKVNLVSSQALESLSKRTIECLAVEDLNTTGLEGADSNDHNTDWSRLVKNSGSSNKGAGTGGSFGIGKKAAFANSQFRTVFYSTKTPSNVFAFQGVSVLAAHKDKNNEITRRTGFYETNENGAILSPDDIPSLFKREKVGTSVIVTAFDTSCDWEHQIQRAVLEYYFIAIHEGKLTVQIADRQVNKANLGSLMEEMADSKKNFKANYFYSALTAPTRTFSESVWKEKFDPSKLYLLEDENAPRQIALARNTGMVIDYQTGFSSHLKFAGVFIANASKLDKLLRATENPMHNRWSFDRHKNPNYAKEVIGNIKSWNRDKVNEWFSQYKGTESEITGLAEYLPDELERPLGAPEFYKIIPIKQNRRSGKVRVKAGAESGNGPGTVSGSGRDWNEGGRGVKASVLRGKAIYSVAMSRRAENSERKQVAGRPTRHLSREVQVRPRAFAISGEDGKYWVLPKRTGRLVVTIHAVGEDGSQELPLSAVEPGVGCSKAFLTDTSRKRNKFEAELEEASGRVKITLAKPDLFSLKVVINEVH